MSQSDLTHHALPLHAPDDTGGSGAAETVPSSSPPRADAPPTADQAPSVPTGITRVIDRTVRKTRLWKAEREDVRAELHSHFREGLDSGRSADELLADFGPENEIARLIRRSKRRQRPASWHFVHRTGQVLGLLLIFGVGIYLFAAVRFFTGKPNVEIDYLGRMATPIAAIPDSERAWPLYREALLALDRTGDKPEYAVSSPLDIDADDEETRQMWEATVAWMPQAEEAIASLHQAAERPKMGLVPTYIPDEADWVLYPDTDFRDTANTEPENALLDGSLVGVLLPHLSRVRELARVLAAHAWITAEGAATATGSGEPAPEASGIVVDDLVALVRLAEHTNEMSLLINQLVGVAVYNLAIQQTIDLLEHHPDVFTRDDLTRLAHEIAGYERGDPLIDLTWERYFFLDIAQRLYSDDGRGGGRITASGLQMLTEDPWLAQGGAAPAPGPLTYALGPVLRMTAVDRDTAVSLHHARFDRAERLMRTPTWERDATSLDGGGDNDSPFIVDLLRFNLSDLLTPALDNLARMPWKTMTLRDAALTAIALELAHRDLGGGAGDWPTSLEDLVPTYLPRLPLDMFDGQPLRYRVTEDGHPVLYSIGIDYDDDGGTPPAETRRSKDYRVDEWQPKEVIMARVSETEAARDPATGEIPNETRLTLRGVPDGDWIIFERVQQ